MAVGLALCVLTFAVTVPWGGWVVNQLRVRGIGKRIRGDGPEAHLAKLGTATMGGLYFVPVIAVGAIALGMAGWREPLLVAFAMGAFGLLGAIDDARGLRDQSGVGWLARNKFPVQWAVALLVAVVVFLGNGRSCRVAYWSGGIELGWWTVPLATLLLVASANAVNLADGLDGLAGGMSAMAFAAFAGLAIAGGQTPVGWMGFVVTGSLLAFLWYNVHPASVFMGDIGSEALGAGLAMVALLSGQALLLPVIGLVFVAEAVSDIVQVAYFKYTKRKTGAGRRVLRMAPLHHHFELGGWDEVQVTQRFWVAAATAAALGVALGLWWLV